MEGADAGGSRKPAAPPHHFANVETDTPPAAAATTAAIVTSTPPTTTTASLPLISFIVPVHNAEPFLVATAESIAASTHRPLQAVFCDDASTDGSLTLLHNTVQPMLDKAGVQVVITSLDRSKDAALREARDRGPGPVRNAAVAASSGKYLAFLDADDRSLPGRLAEQLALTELHPHALVGGGFTRDPPEATQRFTAWANSLSEAQLMGHRFRDATLLQSTFFLARRVFDEIGGYPIGLAEDLLFLYAHIDNFFARGRRGPPLLRVPAPCVVYAYHPSSSLTPRVSRNLLRQLRVEALQRQVLAHPPWSHGFGIWGAGKNGRQMYNALAPEFRARVTAFYDVDVAKLAKPYTEHDATRRVVRTIPILSTDQIKAPIITCVSLDRTDGAFERRLARSGLVEGEDYFPFN